MTYSEKKRTAAVGLLVHIRCAENVAAVGEIKAAGIALITNACPGDLFGWVGVALDVNFGWNADISLFDNGVLQQGRILCNSICCGYWQTDSKQCAGCQQGNDFFHEKNSLYSVISICRTRMLSG